MNIALTGSAGLVRTSNRVWLSTGRVLILATVFFASFVAAYSLVEHIQLPFSNPHGIVSRLSEIKYNPANNVLRFLIIVLLPSAVLAGIYLTASESLAAKVFPSPSSANENEETGLVKALGGRFFYPVLIAVTLLVALNMDSYYATGSFETYEEGQPLSAGLSYQNGGVPYRDFVFFHGLFDEPLRAWLAFGLFGQSVSGLRAVQSITKIATFIFLSAFLVIIFRRNKAFVFLTLFVLYALQPQGGDIALNKAGIPGIESIIVMPRDLALFAFLVVVALLAQRIQRPGSPQRLFWIAAAFSAVPVFGYIHSMERGLYLVTAFAVLAPTLYVFFFREAPARNAFLGGCAAGLVSSLVILAFLIHGEFPDLIRHTAFLASADLQLQFGSPFHFRALPYAMVCLMVAFNLFCVVGAFLRYLRKSHHTVEVIRGFLQAHFVEVGLLLVSMLYFRNGLGRSDWVHVGYVLPAPAILFLYIIFKRGILPQLQRFGGLRKAFNMGVPVLCVLLLMSLSSRVVAKNLLSENFPLRYADDHYVPENWRETIAFLRSNLAADEHFFTLTDEISLYYFVGKECPVRFPLLSSVVRNERYQKEIIDDLQRNKVKYVILDPKSLFYRIDGVPNDFRAPLVFDYIREHYRADRTIDGNMVYVRDGM